MKYKEVIFEQLKAQPYFNKVMIHQLGKQYGLKSATVDTYISQSLRHKEIIPLKNGLYVSVDFYNKNKNDVAYSFYLANIIRKPSYVSSWTALQYYDLTTEAIRTITAVTLKVTRSYETKVDSFNYQSIKKELFSDFQLVSGKFDFFIASPAKALFDLLYFKTRQFRGIKFSDIKGLIAELRVDIDDMDKKNQEKFYVMIKNYVHHE